jgi:histidinol dehydrogenase
LRFLDARTSNFGRDFDELAAGRRDEEADVGAAVQAIVRNVRTRGDAALIELTRKFDRFDPEKIGLAVDPAEIARAWDACPGEQLRALEMAAERIEAFHRRQVPEALAWTDAAGIRLGQRWTPIDAVGLYVPGGTAAYPSSVLMNAIPARVAGCRRLVVAAPTPEGRSNPLVLAACRLAGVDEVYRIGGAQAIAALAYGTESVRPVAKIVGPGNAYVAAAKRQVFGTVGIDSIAGPSEVLIIADKHNDPEWLAADLLAQAEHDTAAQSILMTDDANLAREVAAAVARQLQALPRGNIAGASWETFGAVIVLRSLEEAPPLADRIAAEHVEIATGDPENLAARIRNAGAIFLGADTPEVIGDYVAGSNHVLPTARSARFSSGLGVLDFMKRTSILKLDRSALDALGPTAMTLARAEGLEAHRRSVAIRLGRDDKA